MSGIVLAQALFDNIAEAVDELSFRRGDIVTVLEKDFDGVSGWWLCQLYGRRGIIPYNYVQELSEEEIMKQFPAHFSGTGQLPADGAQTEPHYVSPPNHDLRAAQNSQAPKSPSTSRRNSLTLTERYSEPTNRPYNPENDTMGIQRTSPPHPQPGGSVKQPTTSSPIAKLSVSDGGPSMTVSEGRHILHQVSQVLDVCSQKSNALAGHGHDTNWLEAANLPKAVEQLGAAGRDAQIVLRDLVRLSLDVLRVTRHLQQSGQMPHLCQQLARPIMPIKESYERLAGLVDKLQRRGDIPSVRQTLQDLRHLLAALQVPVNELTGHVLSNCDVLFIPDYEEVPAQSSGLSTPSPITTVSQVDEERTPLVSQSYPSQLSQRSHSDEMLADNPAVRPPPLLKRPSQLADQHLMLRPLPQAPVDNTTQSESVNSRGGLHGRTPSVDSLGSTASSSRRSSSSSEGIDGTGTLKKTNSKNPTRLNIAVGQLTESEISLLAYYAEHMDTLIPNVTNAVEAFCRAISEKQVPKQFVWHSKMVVVGAYKMVYVADTVFQKLVHAELRNHVVACSNRLVDCIKGIVASTKNAAQQYPSISAMRDMVESVSLLPPLALELAESIKEAANLH